MHASDIQTEKDSALTLAQIPSQNTDAVNMELTRGRCPPQSSGF